MMQTVNWVNGISVAVVAGSLARAWLVTRHREVKPSSRADLCVTPRPSPTRIHSVGLHTGGLRPPVQVMRHVQTLRFGPEQRAS